MGQTGAIGGNSDGGGASVPDALRAFGVVFGPSLLLNVAAFAAAGRPRMAGCRMHNADAVRPEWQHREVGEEMKLHWAYGMPVSRFKPGRAIALKGWGSFELEPLPGGRTRLVARGEPPAGIAKAFYALLVEIPHFVMERRMLLGIKERAESASKAS